MTKEVFKRSININIGDKMIFKCSINLEKAEKWKKETDEMKLIENSKQDSKF